MNAQAVKRRAYSTLTCKAVDDGRRILRGLATSPAPDRIGDVIDPLGVKFATPLPLLLFHDSRLPVGSVTFDKPTKAGISFTAELPKITEPGTVKDRVDEAWQSVRAGLIRGVSIGFRVINDAVERLKNGGLKFLEVEVLELSLVVIPMHQDANVETVKSIDQALLAATGRKIARDRSTPPGASGNPKTKTRSPPEEGKTVKTFQEQIAEYEAKCAESQTQMKSLIDTAGGVEKLDADQAQEYDGLASEFKKDNANLERLKVFAESAATAKPLPQTPNTGRSRVEVKQPELAKGTRFARYAMAIAAGKGSISDALEYAKRWDNQTPEVSQYIKAVAGTSVEASPGWGSQLVFQNNLASEFIELLRPMTVVGRINGFRRVPFNVRIPSQTGGSTVNWVGEGAPKPVTELAFSEITLGYTKIAGIVVLSEELVRLSAPSAEETVRRDLTDQISQFMDEQFLLPSVTATSSRPASVTNGVAGVPASGTDADALYKDINDALAGFDAADINTGTLAIVMNRTLARGISTLRNALGQFEFAQITPEGGTLVGYPVVVSNSSPSGDIIFINAGDILMADDGGVRLDASNQATLDMTGSTTANYSLWQQNMVGIRAERWVNYKKRRAEAVQLITGGAYGPT